MVTPVSYLHIERKFALELNMFGLFLFWFADI